MNNKEENKLTIGIFNDSFFPMADGVISVVDNYARRLSQYANVVVFVPKYPGRKFNDEKLPYKVERCRSFVVPKFDYSVPIPKLDRKFLSTINNYKFDIIHIHSPFSIGKAGLKYAIKHNIPCVATMHTQFKQDIKKAVKFDKIAQKLNNRLIKLFNKCDECWAVNNEVARIYYEDYNYKCMPRVMNNATEMVLTDNNEAKEYINKKHNIPEDEKVFIFVGRLNILKNILFIADALKRVKELRPELKFKMLYVGSGNDESKLKTKINELKLNDDIILTGKVSNRKRLAQYYSRADLMLFPSMYDASSIVQIEASSQKTPVLFLKGSATSSMIEDNVNGFLSNYDIDSYAKKIIAICENRQLYNFVAENAYKTIYKTWDETVDEAYELYKKIIDNKKLALNKM